MTRDLSKYHQMVGQLFAPRFGSEEIESYRLSLEQIEFYRDNGYLSGIRVLTDTQIDALREELARFFEPDHAGRELWYEYHTNESVHPDTVLFHALGAWRIGEAFHHPLMVHGSFENRTDQPRRATVINVIRDGVKSDSDEPLLHGVPVTHRGQRLGGQFFPLLS